MKRDYIWHASKEAEEFLINYFPSKKILFIGSIGFDPRTLVTFETLKNIAGNIYPVLLQEMRKGGSRDLRQRALKAEQDLNERLGFTPKLIKFPVFASDGAPIGGIELIKAIQTIEGVADYTDIVIDICAMSRGIFFPLVKYFRDFIKQTGLETSLHILVVDQPSVDYRYIPQYHDRASYMKGFTGDAGRFGMSSSVKLWLPQLMAGRAGIYDTLYRLLRPDDVCPILPFPGIKPKMVDNLIIEYRTQLSSWEIGLQNIVLASESDPLDMYDALIRTHDARLKIFPDQLTILSPLGTKVSTIGGLLAAMDIDLPVAYVETIGYYEQDLASDFSEEVIDKKSLVHVWVDGPIYS